MKKHRYNLYPLLLALLFAVFLFNACEKDEIEEEDRQSAEVNKDFYKLMNDWYYWYDKMPRVSPVNYHSPYELLEELRYEPLDRWSYITTREEFESYYEESKFIGYGFGSAWGIIPESHPAYKSDSDPEWKLWVTFVFNTTDIYEKGVRRSWIIDKINDVPVNERTNINQVLGPNEVGVSNDFLLIDPDGSEVELKDLPKDEVIMNTVLYKEVIETGTKKAGYLVFKNFTKPSFDELEEAVDFFNAEGIDDLILDIRYNGGGQTDVANYLASIIGGTTVADEPFAKYLYNDKLADSLNFTDSLKFVQPNLNLDRLITIATKATASASEMVINGLMPFMPVYIIGDDTYGKPMGMNAWYYEEYAFVPVTFKIANALDNGDYFDGLDAQSYVKDDFTLPFGDPEEASLKEALNFIETGSFSMQPRKKSLLVQPYERMTGLRREIGAH